MVAFTRTFFSGEDVAEWRENRETEWAEKRVKGEEKIGSRSR